jgi:hypothetical protein
MSMYRLEMWFDMANPAVFQWGVVKSNNSGPGFGGGGTPLPKVPKGPFNVPTVTIPDGTTSTFDVYLFDASTDGVARDLLSIKVDYEDADDPNPGNPISWAPALRAGMTGDQFNSNKAGYKRGGPEEQIWSLGTPAKDTQRRWSIGAGYLGLVDGKFKFCATVVVAPANTTNGTPLTFDPEMDVEN